VMKKEHIKDCHKDLEVFENRKLFISG